MDFDVHGPQDPATCKHNAFTSSLSITKIAHAETQHYLADFRIYCDDCRTAFKFLGLPTGASISVPMRSFDGLELRVPIQPEGDMSVADTSTEAWTP